jgi:hypothetical protein
VILGLGLGVAAPAEPATFNKDVLPIFQKHCQGCHRPREAAPMSLLDYESSRPWAKAIRRAVIERTMPPWFADPTVGHFANERRLSAVEIETITQWVDHGAPEGRTKDRPAPVVWRQGWNIRPDVVMAMPKAFPVPAHGTLEYVYIVLPTHLARDTWVTAAEIRPLARTAVHHINAIVRPRGSPWLRGVEPGVPYIPDPASRDGKADSMDPKLAAWDESNEYLAGYAPGMQAQRFDAGGAAKLVPAGSDIVLQIHYTPVGEALTDQIRVGLSTTSKVPAKRFYAPTAQATRWEIPPGDPSYEGTARLTFGEPVELVFLQPHMHLRGKDMTVRLVFPDGMSETILRVPTYRFDWQVVYYLPKPRPLPKGTRVEVMAHWDNSANNPRNPDPTRKVSWGNQSTDEMLSVPMGVLIPN